MAIAQKTFLTLVQEGLVHAGIQQTAPTTVSETTGRTAEMALWIGNAYLDISGSFNGEWKWRKKRDEVQLSSGSTTASAPSGLERYDFQYDHLSRPFFLMRDLEVSLNTSADESQFKVYYQDWETWRGIETDLFDRSSGQPTKFTIIPDTGTIQFDKEADQNYGFRVHYIEELTALSAGTDTPDIPPEFQDIIIWKALIDYCDWDEADRRWRRANNKFLGYLRRMMKNELDNMRLYPASLYNNDR